MDASRAAMDARAAGLLAAIGYCFHARVAFGTVMDLADQFSRYIQTGTWPREAVRPDGESSEKGEGAAPTVGGQAGQAGDGKPVVTAGEAILRSAESVVDAIENVVDAWESGGDVEVDRAIERLRRLRMVP